MVNDNSENKMRLNVSKMIRMYKRKKEKGS